MWGNVRQKLRSCSFSRHVCRQLCSRKAECRVLVGRNSPCSGKECLWCHLSWRNQRVRSLSIAQADKKFHFGFHSLLQAPEATETVSSACAVFWKPFRIMSNGSPTIYFSDIWKLWEWVSTAENFVLSSRASPSPSVWDLVVLLLQTQSFALSFNGVVVALGCSSSSCVHQARKHSFTDYLTESSISVFSNNIVVLQQKTF